MACLVKLKDDIKRLETLFPKGHSRFQIRSASVDEITCRFLGKDGQKLDIIANITVSDIMKIIIHSIILLSHPLTYSRYYKSTFLAMILY